MGINRDSRCYERGVICAYRGTVWWRYLCLQGHSLVEEKVRQLQTENARLLAAVEHERQLNAASQQQTRDLQLVRQQL